MKGENTFTLSVTQAKPMHSLKTATQTMYIFKVSNHFLYGLTHFQYPLKKKDD